MCLLPALTRKLVRLFHFSTETNLFFIPSGHYFKFKLSQYGLKHHYLLPDFPSTETLRFTAGVGVSFFGAYGLPLVWRARKPLPCALLKVVDHTQWRSACAPVHDLGRSRPSRPRA